MILHTGATRTLVTPGSACILSLSKRVRNVGQMQRPHPAQQRVTSKAEVPTLRTLFAPFWPASVGHSPKACGAYCCHTWLLHCSLLPRAAPLSPRHHTSAHRAIAPRTSYPGGSQSDVPAPGPRPVSVAPEGHHSCPNRVTVAPRERPLQALAVDFDRAGRQVKSNRNAKQAVFPWLVTHRYRHLLGSSSRMPLVRTLFGVGGGVRTTLQSPPCPGELTSGTLARKHRLEPQLESVELGYESS